MITPFLSIKYDRLLNYYLAQPVEDFLESNMTPAFSLYIEILYQLDTKPIIKHKFKTPLSKMMIPEFSRKNTGHPTLLSRAGSKTLKENAKEKESMLKNLGCSKSCVGEESGRKVEVHDIYEPDFSSDDEINNKKWLETSYLVSQYGPFEASQTYFSVESGASCEADSFFDDVGEVVNMLSFKPSLTDMDRKKTLKHMGYHSSMVVPNPQKSLQKMASYSKIGLKSIISKEIERHSLRCEKKPAADKKPGNKFRHYLGNKYGVVRESDFIRNTIKESMPFSNLFNPNKSKPNIAIKENKDTALKQCRSLSLFDKLGKNRPTINVFKPNHDKDKIKPGCLAINGRSKNISPKALNSPTRQATKLMTRNFTSKGNFAKATKSILVAESQTKRKESEKKTASKRNSGYFTSCEKIKSLKKVTYVDMVGCIEDGRTPSKLNVVKFNKPVNEKGVFKEGRGLFWKINIGFDNKFI